MNAPTRTPWEAMTFEQKADLVLPLIRTGETSEFIAKRVGAPSRNAIAGFVNRCRAKKLLPPSPGRPQVSDEEWQRRKAAKQAKDAARKRKLNKAPADRPKPFSGVDAVLESQANPKEAGARGKTGSAPAVDVGSRLDAGRTASATSERMDATVVGDESGTLTISRAAAFDPIPGIEPVRLVDIGAGQCRFPVDGLMGREGLMCGASCDHAKSYCASHARLAYTPRG